ncbi:MAG TPA: succinate dehydrogenase, hydrophobic membrane anchor protein [Alphaproteobacteria bacterium]|jgi:succinate dehydrogenase / fumarate reductase membrane anchor subunit
MQFRSPLGKVRGLGSAKDGTHHWWMQRVTALALIPLAIWFVASVVALIGKDHAAFTAWVKNPVSATLLILLLAATFHHAQLGLQVVIEDYVHRESCKVAAILAVKFAAAVLAGIGIVSVLRIAFGA